MAAGVHEVPGQGQVGRVTGEPVQLGQGHLDQRVPAHAVALARPEGLPQLAHGPAGDADQPVVVPGPDLGDGGLGQRPDVEDLVVVGQVAEAGRGVPGDLLERVEVAVGVLGVPDQAGDLPLPGGQLRVGAAGLLPGQRLQPLVDLAVLEHRSAVAAPLPGAGRLEVLEAARRFQLLGAHRDRGLPVDPLPLRPQSAGDRRVPQRQRPQHGPRRRGRIHRSWPSPGLAIALAHRHSASLSDPSSGVGPLVRNLRKPYSVICRM